MRGVERITRRISRSPVALVAALPTRAAHIARHDGRVVGRSFSWLVRSREHTNFTYELTGRNVEHLAWWVSAVTGGSVGDARSLLAELRDDHALRAHIEGSTATSGYRWLADRAPRYGRRAGWYALVRMLAPSRVVETGTDKGLGSCVVAAALLRNGQGRLTTIDTNPDAGYLIGDSYADVVDRVTGDSLSALSASEGEIGVFLHDSLHSYDYELAELEAVEPRLASDALALSDNAHSSDALATWAERSGRRFLFFAEQPERHWYPGGGIGAAWTAN